MTNRHLAVRLARLGRRAAACGLPAEARPVPPLEVLSTLPCEQLVQLYLQARGAAPAFGLPTPRSRDDDAEVDRLRRLPTEELERLYREKLGLPCEEGDPPGAASRADAAPGVLPGGDTSGPPERAGVLVARRKQPLATSGRAAV
jgi:hypothetical protein